MRKNYLLNACSILFILFISLNIFSCSSTKKIKYFQDIPDSGQLKNIPPAAYVAPKVQVDDILSITVQTVDPLASQMINAGNIPISGSSSLISATTASASTSGMSIPSLGATQPIAGYLVDKEGYVDVPVLGKIQVVGHTTSELRGIIHDIAAKYYNNPTVIVRYANFKINIMGEVLKPGVYVMPNEKVSVLDALAMAGDLTVFGKRENVLLIRENEDGSQTPYRINLKKSDIMSAPYYYLRQNDVIYVEPRKAKSDATDAAQTKYVTIAGALLSIILVLAYRSK